MTVRMGMAVCGTPGVLKSLFADRVMKIKWTGVSLAVMVWGMLMLLSSCYAPENIDVIYQDAAQGDVYQFDILAISEWAGHILPDINSVELYADQQAYYLLNELGVSGIGLTYNGHSLTKDDIERYIKRPISELGDIEVVGNRFIIHPFPFYRDLGIECTNKDASDNEVFSTFKKMFHLDLNAYSCAYAVSGALSLRKTWDRMTAGTSADRQIYVGNGDSFGVSQRASAMFNDLPTPEILSLIGFQVDTIGNHSFDNRVDYLQNIINFANINVTEYKLGYSYVATNLKNSSALKNWLTHYTVTIPSEQDEQGLRVAFIGALDNSVFETTKTGSFGSINIDGEMCSIVNEIELAYNENARAFFILGHILTGKESYARLMDALFTFTEPILSESIKNNGKAELHFLSKCESKIVVPNERIRKAFNGQALSQIDFKNQEVKEKYARLVDDIRLEIFSGIIGVLGEAVEMPSAIAYYHEKHKLDGKKGIIWDETASKAPASLKFAENNLFDHDNDFCKDVSLFDGLSCYSLKLEDNPESVYDHPIYYIQFQGKGIDTLKLGISAHKNESIDNGSQVASAYRLSVNQVDLYPVISSLADVSLSLGNTVIDLTDPSYEGCKSLMNQSIATKLGSNGENCTDFFNYISNDPKTYTNINEVRSSDKSDDKQVNYQDVFYECHNAFSKYVLNNDDPKQIKTNLELASAFWACMYQGASSILCGTEKKTFLSPVVFEFKNYQPSTMLLDRSESTYNTNIVSEAFFNYMNKANEGTTVFDVSIINAGTIRDGDLSEISTNNLPQMIPFDNKLVSAMVTTKDIVAMLDGALQSSFESKNTDYGGFPTVSNLAVAYRISYDEAGKPQVSVTEIWQTDKYGVLKELLYLSSISENFFANYSLDRISNKIQVTFPITGTPWICDYQQSYTDCSNLGDGMVFQMNSDSSGHYYSGKQIHLLSHSFLATGGDGYPNNFGLSSASQLTYYETFFRSAVYSYYSGTETNMESDGSLSADQACVKRESYKTIDNLSPEMMNCVLYVNHLFDVASGKKQRWILSATDMMVQTLNSACQADKLGANAI